MIEEDSEDETDNATNESDGETVCVVCGDRATRYRFIYSIINND